MSGEWAGGPPADVLRAVVEAVVFASGEPVQSGEIAEAIGGLETAAVDDALHELEQLYERRGSGLRLERVAGGVQLATRSELGAWVRQFFRQRNRTRISAASLETLAIVAYRQPVTAPEIQAIRGKDSTAGLKTLLEKRLIRILGKKKVVGSPILYGTSKIFLTHFGLNRLDDLPSIEQFEEYAGALEGLQVTDEE